jgi:NitT/TauT family transport system permease protein
VSEAWDRRLTPETYFIHHSYPQDREDRVRGLARYRHLILPASLPSFISGLKQGWAFSWRSLMAGELLVIVPGALSIGVRMQQSRDLNEASLVICYIIVVLVIGILIDVLFNAADNALRKRWGLKEV